MRKLFSDEPDAELWSVAYKWVKACGGRPSLTYFKQEIGTHQDYPSLLSLIDLLDKGGMQYKAVRADRSHLSDFNYPLLAHIRRPGFQGMQLLRTAADWQQQGHLTQWSGIVVFPEKETQWGNQENSLRRRQDSVKKGFAFTFFAIALGLYIVSLFYHPNWPAAGFGVFSLLGLVLAFATLSQELGFKNRLVRRLCGTVSKGGCEKVLKSNYAKGVLGITPADAALLYFITQFALFLGSIPYPSLFGSLRMVAFVAPLISVWSLYTQAVKLKQWCALCLGIVVVLLAQAGLALAMPNPGTAIGPSLAFFAGLLILLTLALLPVKDLVQKDIAHRAVAAELKKWKTDTTLFLSQLNTQPVADTTPWPDDLLMGNPNAPLQLTVACNPYCTPCAESHAQLDALLHHVGHNIRVQVRLVCDPGNEKDPRAIAVKAILRKAMATKDPATLQQMLGDWFSWMDYPRWSRKWATPPADVDTLTLRHRQWFTDNAIEFTPTFFLNGRQLPPRYSLDDLNVLIPLLAQSPPKQT